MGADRAFTSPTKIRRPGHVPSVGVGAVRTESRWRGFRPPWRSRSSARSTESMKGGASDGRCREDDDRGGRPGGVARRARRCDSRVGAGGGAGVDGGRGLRADRRRARRADGGSRDASQRVSGAAVGHTRGRDRAADPQAAPRQLLPVVFATASSLGAGAGVGGPAGVCVWGIDAARRSARRVAGAAHLKVGGQPDLRAAG
jgi:hypothetical protein